MDLVRHNPYGHLAGDFTRGVASHAVGHDKNPPVGNHAKTVLVPRPNDADVGATSGSDMHVIPRSSSNTPGLPSRAEALRRFLHSLCPSSAVPPDAARSLPSSAIP